MRTYTGQGSVNFIIKHIDILNYVFMQYFEKMKTGKDDKGHWWYERDNEQTNNIVFITYRTAKERGQGEEIEEEINERKWDYIINFENDERKEWQVYSALKEFDEKFYRGNLCNLTK